MLKKLEGILKRNNINTEMGELEKALDKLNSKFLKAITDSQKKLTEKVKVFTEQGRYSEALEVAQELERVGEVLRRHLAYLSEEDAEANFYDSLIWSEDEEDLDDDDYYDEDDDFYDDFDDDYDDDYEDDLDDYDEDDEEYVDEDGNIIIWDKLD